MSNLSSKELDIVSEALFLLNQNMIFTYANNRVAKITGYPALELIGKSFFDIEILSSQPAVAQALHKCLIDGEKIIVKEFCLISCRWFEYRVSRNHGGLAVMIIDTTKEDHINSKLVSDEKCWRAILENSALGQVQFQVDGRLIYANKRAAEIFKVSAAELIGKHKRDFFSPEKWISFEKNLIEIIEGHRKTFTSDQTVLLGTGEEIWIRLNVSLVKNDAGQPQYFISAIDNIDERKEIEDSLCFALQASQMGDWDFDAVQNKTRRSKKFDEIFGYQIPKEIWGYDDFSKHVHPDDRKIFNEHFVNALSTSEEFKIETRIVWPDNTVHWILLRGRVYMNRQGRAVRMAGLVSEITAEKQAAEEIQNARLAAEDANREKSNFLANMSHEIRTPLSAILGFTEALKEPTLNAEDRLRYLDILTRNGKALSTLINDILDLSKVEAGFLEIEESHLNLPEMVEDITSLLRMKAEIKKLNLNVIIDQDVPAYITTDTIRLRQILINILGNAIKFTEKGEVKLQVSVAANDRKTSSEIQFRVSDTGTGIAAESASKLFNPFVQADSSTTRKFGGTGLGLALSKRFARAMKGDLILESSEIEKGSTFRLTLPLVLPIETVSNQICEISEANVTAARAAQQFRGLKGLKVLVADDSPDNQVLLVQMLKKYGVKIELADDGLQAVEKALQQRYDIVLMDMQMPYLDGYSATRKLRSAGFDVPILALTANAMRSDRDKCLAAGCSEYLSKPIEPHKLYKLMGLLTESVSH